MPDEWNMIRKNKREYEIFYSNISYSRYFSFYCFPGVNTSTVSGELIGVRYMVPEENSRK